MLTARKSPFAAAIVALALAAGACGGGAAQNAEVAKAPSAALSMDTIDKDPLVLLPSGPLAVATVDAKALYASQSFGAQAAKLAEMYFPLGADAGFSPSKDLDRVTIGSYSLQGVDVLAVLSGRFDVDKIALAAKNHTQTKAGVVVQSTYAGHDVYTVANVGVTVLSPHTALAGTEGAIRRALDRLKDGRVKRDVHPWMLETIETAGAAFALAADFKDQPLSGVSVSGFRLAAAEGLAAARAVGTFQSPGVQVAGSLTYKDADHAKSAVPAIKQLIAIANATAGLTGVFPQIQSPTLAVKDSDVQITFGVDETSLENFLTKLPQIQPPP